jgi:phage gp16-like protein
VKLGFVFFSCFASDSSITKTGERVETMTDSTKRPKFNIKKARQTLIRGLARKADSRIFQVLDVTPVQVNGRLKYDGKTAQQYATLMIRYADEEELHRLANALGISIS